MDNLFCSFSGHRNIPPAAEDPLRRVLMRRIGALAEEGFTGFLCGGALGFDMLAAEAVITVRAAVPELTLTLVLPCPGHDRGWSPGARARFRAVREAADKTVTVSPLYTRYCMLQRNRYLVDHSSRLVCCLTRDTGGTAYTVRYALKRGIPVENLAVDAGIITDRETEDYKNG
ncbi:MAG: DUF1273 family protein [Oscillospiraceae bacterium]|nr:DUF1273 family protein [Oscillospiraceae bacterium]